MSESTYPNQVAVIEIDDKEAPKVIGYTYPLNLEAAQNGSESLGDIEWPEQAGVYVWTGELWYDDGWGSGEYGGRGDPDGGADGVIRPATAGEIEAHRLGFLAIAANVERIRALEAALGWLLPMAESYLKNAPTHPDNAKLETARGLLANRRKS